MTNYWYASHDNEIFLDLDSRRALRRAMTVLSVAIRTRRLPISKVYLYKTRQKNHAHMIIVLSREMSAVSRIAWGLWMGNDRLRSAYVLMRLVRASAIRQIDLLVSVDAQYYRDSDATCGCKQKHKEDKVTKRCPAMTTLLGDQRSADYFARTGPVRSGVEIRFPWGRVPLKLIKNWENQTDGKQKGKNRQRKNLL